MKFFATTVALAAAVAAEADPQFLVNAPVVSSPLLKNIVPTNYAYKQPIAFQAPTQYVQHAPIATQYVHQAPIATQYVHHAPIATQYVAKPVEVKPAEKVEEVEGEQKVVSYAQPTFAYAQPAAVYAHQQVAYAQPQVAYAHQQVAYAKPAFTQYNAAPMAYASPVAYAAPLTFPRKVYHAKNGDVEHTVISKREAEAEPIDYVNYQTGPLSTLQVPTFEKTLRAYNKFPVHAAYAAPVAAYQAAPVAYNAYQASPVAYQTAGVYAHQYTAPQVYANQFANQYQYNYPTYF